jgi:hypothetical protein
MAKWTVVCLLAVLALAGCGSRESAEMSAAVKAIDPQLRSFYDHSYAGLEVVDDKLIVYRKPNAAVDALVRDLADDADVDVELRDAPYALEQLQPLAERVDRDRHHWRTRNFPVELVVTRPDCTGVNAYVATDDLEAARAEFRERYGDEPVFVDRPSRTGIVPVG